MPVSYRDCFYYHDGTLRVGFGTWRFRLVVTPASNAPMPDLGDEPAWGDDPTDDVWFRIPGNVIFQKPEGSESGFQELFIGFPELPTLKLSMNFRSLSSTAMDALRTFIANPTHPTGGSIYGRDYPTSNVWRLYIDRTGAATDVAVFEEHFCGVQTPGLTTKFTSNRVSRLTRVDLELQHILRKVLGIAHPTDATSAIAGATDVRSGYVRAWDFYWTNDALSQAFNHTGSHGSGAKKGLAEFYRFVDLWGAIGIVLSDIYGTLLRQAPSGGIQFHSVVDVLAHGGFLTGTPYDAFTRYKYSYNRDGSKGPVLPPEENWILGWVRRADDADILVGGYFYDDGDSSFGICRYRTLWDYVTDQFKAGGTKAIVRHPSHGFILVYCHRIYASYVADPVIEADDCLGGEDVWEVGANVQSGASCEVKGGDGSDLSPIDYLYGSDEEPDYSIGMSLHNLPDTRKPSALEFYNSVGIPAGLGTLGGFHVNHNGFRVNCLYYFDTPPGFTEEIPLRIHHYVGWSNGIATQFPCHELYDLPVPTEDINGRDELEDQLWFKLLKLLIRMTFESCMPFAIAQQIAVQFGDPQMSLYEITVTLDKLDWQDVGQRIDGTAWANANIFLPAGETWAADIPGQPVVLRGQESLADGTFKAKLLAPDT